MKRYFYILNILLLFSLISYSQSKVQIDIKECNGFGTSTSTPVLFLFVNDSLIRNIKTRNKNTITIKGLKKGKYSVKYKSIYDKIESKTIEIAEKKKYFVEICLDKFNYNCDSCVAFIDKIKNREFYTIEMSSQGCFHFTQEKITIKKDSNKYYMSFQEIQRELSAKEIGVIKTFEERLNQKRSFGCTTSDHYTLTYNSQIFKITDSSCSWDGFYLLKKKLDLLYE